MLKTLQNLLQHFIRWMAPPTGPEDITGLRLARGTALDSFASYVKNHPEDYEDFLLQSAVLCDTDTIVPHESIVFKFFRTLEDGTIRYYFVVADRVTVPEVGDQEPTTPSDTEPSPTSDDSSPTTLTPNANPNAVPSQRPNHSRTTKRGSDSWDSLRKPAGDADDRVRQWVPTHDPNGTNWWKGALGSSSSPAAKPRAVFDFDPERTNMTQAFTLNDVVLALRSVSEVAPTYSFRKHNCWWLARCTLLLLFLRQRQSPISTSPASRIDIEAEYFRRVRTTLIPVPASLTEKVMKADTATAEANFVILRAQVDARLQEYNNLRRGAERSDEAERRAREAERIAAIEMEQRTAAERAAFGETEKRMAAEHEVSILADALRERGIDPASITTSKSGRGPLSTHP